MLKEVIKQLYICHEPAGCIFFPTDLSKQLSSFHRPSEMNSVDYVVYIYLGN